MNVSFGNLFTPLLHLIQIVGSYYITLGVCSLLSKTWVTYGGW